MSREINLVAQYDHSGNTALILSSNMYPDKSIKMAPQALSTFHWFTQYALYVANGKYGLCFQTQPNKSVNMPHDVLMNIFYFLHADIAQLITKQRIVPVRSLPSLPSEQQELECLALSLCSTSSKTTKPNLFFFDYKLKHLSNASLNADLEIAQRIIEKTDPEKLRILLSTETTAIITHLGIERTGTPLQMALYSHDETMFKTLAAQMTPEIVALQCKKVFSDHGVCSYSALIEKQKVEANALCAEVKMEFSNASNAYSAGAPNAYFTKALDCAPGTIVTRQDALNRFNINLDQYVRVNPVHNPYILQRLFEIYDEVVDWEIDPLLSQRAIGVAQRLSSARWLQHYACGVYYLAYYRGEIPSVAQPKPLSLFSCNPGGSRALDIRSHLDCCIDMYGKYGKCLWPSHKRHSENLPKAAEDLSKFLSIKNNEFEKLMPRYSFNCTTM